MAGNRYQILCCSKKTENSEKIITHIGGRNPLGEVWKINIEQVINDINSESFELFLNKDGKNFPIHIIKTKNGISIQTSNSNLILELPDCSL
jgi:hypothetical protein